MVIGLFDNFSMFHAYCIIQPDKDKKDEELSHLLKPLQIHAVDQFWLSDSQIGIGQIRELRQFLTKTPFASSSKVAIIDIDLCSLEAQHALLKSLEEPPPRNTLILTASNHSTVLPTVISRCVIKSSVSGALHQEFDPNLKDIKFWTEIFNNSMGNRLLKAEYLPTERNELILWINTAMNLFHHELHTSTEKLFPGFKTINCAQILKLLLETKSLLEKNISLKLTIDNLLLNMPLPFVIPSQTNTVSEILESS